MPKERGNDDKSFNSFGGRDKSRGVKHQKDKTKYKPKSVKDPKHVPPKLKRNLGSNWDRYEAEEDSEIPQLNSSTDFSILANAPIAQGQHFQFKQDKIIAEEVGKTQQGLFSLDLNMLKHSILTVPFYKRVGIDETYFTKNQISLMDRNAEISLVKYEEKYSSNKTEKCTQERSINITVNDSMNETENIVVPESPINEPTFNEDVSELVTKMDNLAGSERGHNTENAAEEDLEQWLDDILDD